jgi:hypothetical protein
MNGGASDRGTIFKVMKDGTGFQKLHDFNGLQPSGNSLSEGTDNYLLGIAKSGGSNNRGAVFKIKKDGTGFEVVKDFDDNTGEATQGGSLASHPDGNFYGLALRTPLSGTLFRIAGNGTAFQIIYTFDLVGPANSLTLAPDGNFFAITGAGGKIFRIRNDGTGFQQASLLPGGLIEPRPLNPNFALIERSTQTITFAAMSSLTYGDDDQVLTATSDSGLPITYLSTNSNVASVTGNTLKITGAGTATIRATQPGDALFKPAEIVSQQLHVAKAPHVITFGPLEQMKMSPQPFELHGTSTSALPLVYINSNASVATVSGNKVTLIGIGSTTITATQPGNNNYLPASDVSQDLVVTKGDQTITFPEISSKTLGGPAFQLTATAPAPVTYSTMSDKVTIAESTVTMVKAGRLSIIASQNGNANYNAAAPVERSFCINPPKPVVTITVTNAAVTFTSSNASGNQWYRDETVITNATQASFQSNDFGAYSVKTTVDDCVSEMSAPFVVTSTRDENDESITYTNPVSTVLTVWVSSAHDGEVQFQLIDMLGRPTLSASGWTNRENTIEVGHLAKGMYVLRVSGERNAAVRVHAARVYKE